MTKRKKFNLPNFSHKDEARVMRVREVARQFFSTTEETAEKPSLGHEEQIRDSPQASSANIGGSEDNDLDPEHPAATFSHNDKPAVNRDE